MLVIFLTLGICHHLVCGCFFKSSYESNKRKLGYWDEKDYTRQVYSPGCDCGIQDSSSKNAPWIIHVHSQVYNTNNTKVCAGTILTNNLVATTHKCLILHNHRIQVYDTWNPRPKWTPQGPNVVNPQMLYLSTSKSNNESEINKYQVKDIILSTRYALSTVRTRKGVVEEEDDLALLVVQENLFTKGHTAICVPKWSETKSSDVANRLGIYSDTVEVNKTEENNLVILYGKECNVDAKKKQSADDSFCLRHIDSFKLNEGGPLTVKSTAGSGAYFMVGLASAVGEQHGATGYRYAYFTNILPLVKYIELHATKAKSVWCRPPKSLKLGPKVKVTSGKYAWKNHNFKDRDESLDCVCGIRNNATIPSEVKGRIAGGEEAEPYEFPWMILLAFAYGEKKWYLCGGSIINDRTILTAAHCVTKYERNQVVLPTETRAILNKHEFDYDPHQSFLEVETIYYHPGYIEDSKLGNIDSDIALMILKEPLKFSSRKETGGIKDLRPVCLPKMSNPRIPQAGELALVSGWGLTDPDDSSSAAAKLQKLDAPILSKEQCQGASRRINDNMICAGYRNRRKDSAKGDSGGPLMLWSSGGPQGGGQLVQIGLVSFGQDFYDNHHNPTKITSTLGVYTYVQKFIDFVDFYSEMEGAKWCKP